MRRLLTALLLVISTAFPAAANDVWKAAAAPGHIVMIRHATAPGIGDPPGFRVDDCATQRNLSDAGREEAKRIGQAFRANGIARARVLSSQWCRCLDTARLLDLGAVEPWPALNSFFDNAASGPAKIAALRSQIQALDLAGPVVMVTHQVVISGLAGKATASGEMVVLKRETDGRLAVVGSIPPPR